MSFFQRQCYAPDQSFAPLVRLLNDWDTIARENAHVGHRRHHRQPTPSFVPKFDVIETENEYQLHGELGGIAKKDLNIEFSDEHTLVVKGRIEKSYKSSDAAETTGEKAANTTTEAETSAEDEDAAAVDSMDEDITESTIIDVPAAHSPSLKATVADEEDEERAESGSVVTEEKNDAAAIEALQKQKQQEQEQQRKQQQQRRPAYKYWLSERSVGQFIRVFKFPGRIERDAVTAGLENGILTVTVPKAKNLAVREIPIF